MADAFEIHDAHAKKLDLCRIEGTSTYSSEQMELHNGRCPVLNVLQEARTLVLLKAGREVRRLELSLVAASENLITP